MSLPNILSSPSPRSDQGVVNDKSDSGSWTEPGPGLYSKSDDEESDDESSPQDTALSLSLSEDDLFPSESDQSDTLDSSVEVVGSEASALSEWSELGGDIDDVGVWTASLEWSWQQELNDPTTASGAVKKGLVVVAASENTSSSPQWGWQKEIAEQGADFGAKEKPKEKEDIVKTSVAWGWQKDLKA
ncbi:hypothetical protein TrLO_g352 [Triparma laevis f. longispina]|uniref:Uncharacterized protein n=1 Tax=Triparma laevis f. longispina TaxID=1714387 RepID=A0A9W7CJM3_9STRA|nr:hypothetical protein TrLO_g352 [Triparma laevis f. longispina]